MSLGSIYEKRQNDRINMGDILTDIEYKILQKNDKEITEITITYPYSVVLTQDCDLEQDYDSRNTSVEERKNEDKFVHSILLCPIFNADEFKSGEHLSELGINGEIWCSDLWKPIKKNIHKRFCYIKKDENTELPDLIIDFKNFFTLSRDYIYDTYEEKHLTSVRNLFREDISNRFAHYISRIGLPRLS